MDVPNTIRIAGLKKHTAVALAGLAVLLAACEDQGNPGDDNLLTGASLVVVVVIVVVIAFLVMRRRRSP